VGPEHFKLGYTPARSFRSFALIQTALRPSLFLLLATSALMAQAGEMSYFDAAYKADIHPEAGAIDVELNLSGERLPRELVLHIDPKRHRDFRSTDPLQIGASQVTWHPQGKKSRLRYRFTVDHERGSQHYDSLLTPQWAVFRGDKMMPRTSMKARRGLEARATLEFVLPPGWSVVTAYPTQGEQRFTIDNPRRRFDRPEGWVLAGKIGTRSERINRVQTIVAAPAGESARRQDMLAFLNWNLPQLTQVFTDFPHRVLIVSAGDPMWHGGLSGPSSLFIHSQRPLISENRTSTLLHELVHVAMGLRSDEESDWIVEGLAEFYSIETLRRSGGIGAGRYEEAIASLQQWARRSTTARAVLTMKELDREVRAASGDKASLDDIARRLAKERGKVTLDRLQKLTAEIAGHPSKVLVRDQLMKPLAAPAK
jgi:predicted metalloprotease with PDZ domain